MGHEPSVNIQVEDVAKALGQNVSPRLIDFLEIASYIYSADCGTVREKKWADDSTEPWERDFSFVIPVRDLEFWARPELQSLIVETLGFLSSDRYSFTFERLKHDRPEQRYFNYREAEEWPFLHPERVIMFSGGLDSLAGALEAAASGARLVLVSHRSTAPKNTLQTRLFREFQKLYPNQMVRVPVLINKRQKYGHEPTQRTRSFLFAALGTVVGQSIRAKGVRFYENGVVSLNLPIAQEALRSRASRTTHPFALHLLSRLCESVVGSPFVVDNPFISKTKTEVLDSIAAHGGSHLIQHTCSCSRSMFQSKSHPHCGKCSQCIDRRFAAIASGAEKHDPAERYALDVFLGPREGVERAIAIGYVRHGVELARKSPAALATCFNMEISRAVHHLAKRSDAARELVDMHQRHGEAVCHVLEQILAANAAKVVNGDLDPTCLLAIVARGQHLGSSGKPLTTAEASGPSLNLDRISAELIVESIRKIEAKIEGGSAPKTRQNPNARPKRREAIFFAGITLGLEGVKFCAFLKDHKIEPRWEQPCPENYVKGYLAGSPWTKKIQDEKCRARTKMKTYAKPALADVFNIYLSDRFLELTTLLNSPNSQGASKN